MKIVTRPCGFCKKEVILTKEQRRPFVKNIFCHNNRVCYGLFMRTEEGRAATRAGRKDYVGFVALEVKLPKTKKCDRCGGSCDGTLIGPRKKLCSSCFDQFCDFYFERKWLEHNEAFQDFLLRGFDSLHYKKNGVK